MSKRPTVSMRKRSAFSLVLIILMIIVLLVSLFRLQVLDPGNYAGAAASQQLRSTTISANRGTIYDANMVPIAISAVAYRVVLAPSYITDDDTAQLVADGLSKILMLDRDSLYKKTKKKTSYENVKDKVEKDKADEVRKFISDNSLNCIRIEETSKRYYPYGTFASTVLGFTGTDNTGLAGLESYYDSQLTGTDGKSVAAKNAWGTDMPFGYENVYAAKDGNSLVLSIDQKVQYFVEKNLEEGVREQGVTNRSACAVINVKTGAVLAMSTKYDYDLNSPFEITDSLVQERIALLTGKERTAELLKAQQLQWQNKAITDTYEPGSVFKTVMSAACMEEKIVNEKETFSCSGHYTILGQHYSCWKSGGHGVETFVDAIVNSCNPVFFELGNRLGISRFCKYYEAFGFTEKTGIDLPGEATITSNLYHSEKNMGTIELTSSSIGQTFKITPLQMLTAASATINGGYLMKPYVVSQVLDADGNIVSSTEPVVKRQVVSEETSIKLAGMLEQVVLRGSGKNAYIMGYRVGGKTGTSQKIDKKNEDGTMTKEHVYSFFAFAPVDDPQIGILCMMDSPTSGEQYASRVAVPVVSAVLADILPYLDIETEYTTDELEMIDVSTPSVIGETVSIAKSSLSSKGLTAKVVGSGEKVVSQVPSSGVSIPSDGTVILYTDKKTEIEYTTVPDVVKKSASAANKTLGSSGLNVRLEGGGLDRSSCVVSKQSPAAGEKIKIGDVVTVTLIDTGGSD